MFFKKDLGKARIVYFCGELNPFMDSSKEGILKGNDELLESEEEFLELKGRMQSDQKILQALRKIYSAKGFEIVKIIERKDDLLDLSIRFPEILLIGEEELKWHPHEIRIFKGDNPSTKVILIFGTGSLDEKSIEKNSLIDGVVRMGSMQISVFSFLDKLAKEYEKIKGMQNSSLFDYLRSIFPEVPVEVLEGVVAAINEDFKSIEKISDKTASGMVGRIFFSLNKNNYIFKVYSSKNSKLAELEFEVGLNINKDEKLSKICARTLTREGQVKPLSFGDHYLILTEDVRHKLHKRLGEENHLISILSGKIRIQNPELVHKIFVIALFHSRMKRSLSKKHLDSLVMRREFYDWKVIEDAVLSANKGFKPLLPQIRKLYNDIRQKHEGMMPTIIAHNDPKWDNFINGFLIDFGSVHANTPYVDLARILMTEAFQENFNIENYITAYLYFRLYLDDGFSLDDELRHRDDNIFINTYERIFSESLRISMYKSLTKEHSLVEYFVRVAVVVSYRIMSFKYQELLKNLRKDVLLDLPTSPVAEFESLKRRSLWYSRKNRRIY